MRRHLAHEWYWWTKVYMLLLARLGNSAADTKHKVEPVANVALSLQGGGFRAHCTDAGLLAGLLKFVGKTEKLPAPNLDNTGLLSRFDTFSTNSGSTWFFSQLAYSRRFQRLVEDMAASPQTVADQLKRHWFDPMNKALHVNPTLFNPMRDIAEWLVTKILGKGDEDTLFAMQFILSTESTWNEFVSIILESTASINRTMTLSSPVGAWVRGKYWLVDHTILLPSDDRKAFLFTKTRNISTLDFYQTAMYFAAGSGEVPLLLPAKFSMELGKGANSSAPFPYIATSAMQNITSFEYKGIVLPIIDEPTATSGFVSAADLAGGALIHNTGRLPISDVATASSAFAGTAPVTGLLANKILARVNHADLTPWLSSVPDGAAFSGAADLIDAMKQPFGLSKHSIDLAAKRAVHGVIDGGFSDGTGLGIAVASGAKEIFLVLNSFATCSPFYVEVLCKDGPPPENPLKPSLLYPLFDTPVSWFQKAYATFSQMKIPNNTKFLKRVVAGTVRMATADNKYFGIKRGRHVTVHIVNVCSDLQIGFFEDYVNFGLFAQELVMAILDKGNELLVRKIILPMMTGHKANITAGSPILV